MQTIRPVGAASFSTFGRRPPAPLPAILSPKAKAFGDEVRLFALTFAGGFLFTSVYLA